MHQKRTIETGKSSLPVCVGGKKLNHQWGKLLEPKFSTRRIVSAKYECKNKLLSIVRMTFDGFSLLLWKITLFGRDIPGRPTLSIVVRVD